MISTCGDDGWYGVKNVGKYNNCCQICVHDKCLFLLCQPVLLGSSIYSVEMWFSVVIDFLWSLVEANHSQIIAYVSFMGDTLSNHAYADLTTVGEDISASGDTVRCHTDLTTCTGIVMVFIVETGITLMALHWIILMVLMIFIDVVMLK